MSSLLSCPLNSAASHWARSSTRSESGWCASLTYASLRDLVGVHGNTFRYRLRGLAELASLDLDDPVERLVVQLQPT